MMELISYGAQIRSGKYRMHSKFNSAVNFIIDDSFAFVVNENIGSGPLNIVVKGILPLMVRSLVFSHHCLYINENKLSFDTDLLYDHSFYLNEFDYNNFTINLIVLEDTIKRISSKESLAFILDPEKRNDFSSSTEIEYAKRVDYCVQEILFGNILTGVKNIKGLGPGLTPAGDDFNCGLLIALNVISKISSLNLDQSINMIFTEALGCNLFANSFLRCASSGRLFNKFKELINAVLYSNENAVIEKVKMVLSIGQT